MFLDASIHNVGDGKGCGYTRPVWEEASLGSAKLQRVATHARAAAKRKTKRAKHCPELQPQKMSVQQQVAGKRDFYHDARNGVGHSLGSRALKRTVDAHATARRGYTFDPDLHDAMDAPYRMRVGTVAQAHGGGRARRPSNVQRLL